MMWCAEMQMLNASEILRNAGGVGESISQNSLRVLPDFLAGKLSFLCGKCYKYYMKFYKLINGFVYDKLFGPFWFRPFYSALMKEVKKYSTEKQIQNPIILDVACGTGNVLSLLKSITVENNLYGTDYSQNMTQATIQKLPDAHIATVSSKIIPFNNVFFDCVVNTISFHHFPHQSEIIKQMKSVLKQDGLLVIIDVVPFPYLPYFFTKLVHSFDGAFHVCSTKEMIDMIDDVFHKKPTVVRLSHFPLPVFIYSVRS